MKFFIVLMLFFMTACDVRHIASGEAKVVMESGEYVVRVENPIIEFCERLFPEVLYPNEVERETEIVACMKLCSESGACAIPVENLPDFNQAGIQERVQK